MGIFDFLFGGTESSIERHSKKVVNLNAQIEERNASAEWLAENGSPEAIAALLKRFSIRYEHAMKDTEEVVHLRTTQKYWSQCGRHNKELDRKELKFCTATKTH